MQIREYSHEDYEGVAFVMESAMATLRETYRPGPNGLKSRNAIKHQLIRLVAIIDGQIIGSVSYFFEGDVVRVIGLGVHATFRRQGVARMLMSEVAKIGIDNNKHKIQLHTIKETGNCPIFQKMGYSIIAEEIDKLMVGEKHEELHDVLLEKKILV